MPGPYKGRALYKRSLMKIGQALFSYCILPVNHILCTVLH